VSDSRPAVTELLRAWTAGNAEARERAIALLYPELRRRAAARLRQERRGVTLQPTALVHEAYIRLVDQRHVAWQNRAHFLALASEMMRRILVDRARARRAAKRSGRWVKVTLEDGFGLAGMPGETDLLDLHAALDRLAADDPVKGRIAELRFFGGLSFDEMAEVLKISPRTIDRHWQAARAWLYRELSGGRRKEKS
jgi:RNA polymerase sigma factor (TIGR02999 family)